MRLKSFGTRESPMPSIMIASAIGKNIVVNELASIVFLRIMLKTCYKLEELSVCSSPFKVNH